MAIVQIARIQHRRGRKLAGTGMPQLASGEIGWAVDTQELFIGNGSTSEGAPYVGNTKILTEHDNIFTLAELYTFKPDDSLWGSTAPVARSLQDRLDEVVSVFSFGATGNGSDQTSQIQRAIDSLYLNGEVRNRVILWFPSGVYTITETIQLPPYATIRGAGKEKTIINAVGCDAFTTVHYDPNNPLATVNNFNQAQQIELSGVSITVDTDHKALDVRTCAFSVFKDLKLKGGWVFETVYVNHMGISLFADTTLYTSKYNIFENIEIENFNYGIYSDYDVHNNVFRNIVFNLSNYGIAFGYNINNGFPYPSLGSPGATVGPMSNSIEGCSFDRIAKEGIIILNGTENSSHKNAFYNVGNENAGSAAPVHPVIRVADPSNTSNHDYFERTMFLPPNLLTDQFYNVEYVAEAVGLKKFENVYPNYAQIGTNVVPKVILKFPAPNRGTLYIDYVYTETGQSIVRKGIIEVVTNVPTSTISLNEDYSYVGNPLYSTSMNFSVTLSNISPSIDGQTLIMSVTNTAPVTSDRFTFTIRTNNM